MNERTAKFCDCKHNYVALKDKKGISLVSVIVTIVVMLVILTSIVFSTNRTNEIKRAMLINSDIEELTKKVEVYYLEKETLPVDEDENYQYPKSISELSEDEFKETPVYSRLQISLLDNVTLNNKEELPNQWYVINPETHTIYFVKKDASKLVIQDAQYSSKYETLINNAKVGTGTGRINFNQTMTSPTTPGGDITLSYQDDVLRDDPNSIDYEMLYGDQGPDTGPNAPTLPTSTANYSYKNYIGWNEAGTTATNLVLQYDGEYNAARSGTYHSNSTNTWKNLVNPGTNDCTFKNNNFSYKYNASGYYTDTVSISNYTEDTYLLTYDSSKGDTGYTDSKYDFWSKSSNKTMSFGTKNISLSGHSSGFYAKPSLSFSDSNSYTIEMVFYYTGSGNIYFYDFGYLTSSTAKTGTYNDGGFLYEYFKHEKLDAECESPKSYYNTSNGIISDWKVADRDTYMLGLRFVTGLDMGKGDKNTIKSQKTTFINNISNKLKEDTYKRNAYISNTTLYINEGGTSNTFNLSSLSKNKVHTITIIYNKDTSKISVYIDKNKISDSISKTVSFSNKMALFANGIAADIIYVDHRMSGHIAWSVNLWNFWGGPFDEANRALFRCKYSNCSTNNFYSVRIYNRALTNAEITYNYITDHYRFGSGA